MAIRRKRDKPIKFIISETAFSKISVLIRDFETEVGLHGTVTRKDNIFMIDDIFVYPQISSHFSVDTEQFTYERWLMSQKDEIFNNLRMHGHSHVNFSVLPSLKDKNHRDSLVSKLNNDMFYIFMIWNKKCHVYSLLYDYNSKTVFNSNFIEIYVIINGIRQKFKKNEQILNYMKNVDMNAFIKESHSFVKKYNQKNIN